MTDLHPDQLHALAAAWSLRAARGLLAAEVAGEWAERKAEASFAAAAGGLQAWRPMIGRAGGGGHGDPTGRTTVSALEPRAGRLARLAESVTATLLWLVDRLQVRLAAPDPLYRLRRAVSELRPSTAEQLQLWLAEADTRIREALHVPPADRPVPGLGCPSCGVRQLVDLGTPRVVAPVEQLPGVVCRAGCRCAGESCTCRMPVRQAGAVHIWTRDSDLGRRAVVLVA